MNFLDITFAGDNAWPDIKDKAAAGKLHNLMGRNVMKFAVLNGGMASGLPSVTLRVDLDDGSTVVCETSARQIVTFARLLVGRFPQLIDGAEPPKGAVN